jgi:hypothetical protein
MRRMGAGELRREGHEPHRPGGEQPVEKRRIRVAPRRGRVRPESRRTRGTAPRDGRRARVPRAVGRHLPERGDELVLRRADEGGEVRRHARLQKGFARTA